MSDVENTDAMRALREQLAEDPELRAAYEQDPEGVLRSLNLSAGEAPAPIDAEVLREGAVSSDEAVAVEGGPIVSPAPLILTPMTMPGPLLK